MCGYGPHSVLTSWPMQLTQDQCHEFYNHISPLKVHHCSMSLLPKAAEQEASHALPRQTPLKMQDFVWARLFAVSGALLVKQLMLLLAPIKIAKGLHFWPLASWQRNSWKVL